MRFTSLVATALALAPSAVYGYGVFTAHLSEHEGCHPGDWPNQPLDKPKATALTPDTCTKVSTKHSFAIDAYSLSVEAITKDATIDCHGVGIFSNDECVGYPDMIVPIHPKDHQIQTPCFSDVHYERHLSLKLYCEKD
ncbi:hypothetical protein N8T08_002972 [Aspergillus melleus]|uniref:Uncharacterized protein n=1 Tax=Aspergillus melleus TaxID=138277 RepID=A0ACC3B8A3_9EURO|nr:hypothetical protein N8T08_002972 [Aspergillus melleus]